MENRIKPCLKCGKDFKGRVNLKWWVCQDCRTEHYRQYMREYATRPVVRTKRNQYLHRLRLRAMSLIGDRCARCGEQDIAVLVIDHINGGGTRERRVLRGATFWLAIVNGRRTVDDLQILCANCHMRKSNS